MTSRARRNPAAAPSDGVAAPLPPLEALRLLEAAYGPIRWRPRYDPISELVFTVLSQHTSDLNAERAFTQLLEEFGSWEAVAQGDTARIARAITVGGLAQQKAPRIRAILNRIQELRGHISIDFLRELPLEEAKAWLKGLPGVGPKTAAVVLCFSLGMPAMAVDTHVYRVTRRLGFIGPRVSADDAHDILERMVPPEKVYAFHVALITHGRRTCKAQRPLCEVCVLRHGCPTAPLYLGEGARGRPRSRSVSSS